MKCNEWLNNRVICKLINLYTKYERKHGSLKNINVLFLKIILFSSKIYLFNLSRKV